MQLHIKHFIPKPEHYLLTFLVLSVNRNLILFGFGQTKIGPKPVLAWAVVINLNCLTENQEFTPCVILDLKLVLHFG